MSKIIKETKIQPTKIVKDGSTKYVYTVEEYEQATVEFMESQGHKIDRDFAMDLVWADDEFSDKYPFYMNVETQTYNMTEADMQEYKSLSSIKT